MNDSELQVQFKRCQEWEDPEQWELLAIAYFERGYYLNAIQCFKNADKAKRIPKQLESKT